MKQNQQGIAHLLPIIGIVILISAASAIFWLRQDSKDTTASNNSQTSQSSTSDLTSPLPNDLLTIDKIKEISSAQADASLTSVELESEDGTFFYKVKLANGSILFFDAKTGAKITKPDGDDGETEDGSIPAGFVAKISYEQAREIALKQKPGGNVTKIELETEEGKVVYSVRFSDKARVDVDATTGEIIRTKAAKEDEKKATSTAPGTPSSGSSNASSNNSSGGSNSSSNSSSDNSTDDNDSEDDDDEDSDDDHGGNSGSGGSNSGRSR